MTLTMTKKVSECQAETVQFMSLEKPEDEHRQDGDFCSGSTLLRRGKKLEDNNNLTKEDIEYVNYRQLLKYEQAPEYLQHNPYIRDGYRKLLPTKLCWESIFWWTNETMNIWTHLFGFFLVLGLTINDLVIINIHATFTDKVVAAILLSCFMVCMALSALYHTFSCRSECDYNTFLMYDLFGIALSLLAIYTSGVYYAFWCHHELKAFYMTSVTLIFVVAMALQVPRLRVPYAVKMCVFIGWAAYGVLPTLHWCYAMGGFGNPMVKVYMTSVTLIFVVAMALQVPRLRVPYAVKMCVFIGWAAYGVLPTLHWCYAMGGFGNPMVKVYMTSVTLIFVVAMALQVPRLRVPYAVKMCVFIGWAAYGVLPTLHWCYAMGGFGNPMVKVYMTSVTLIFVVAMALQVPRLRVPYAVKMCVFIGWAAYGVLPTLHWCYAMGGFGNPMVKVYMTSVTLIFVVAMALQVPRLRVPYAVKMCVFIGWAAYGVLPTLHWCYAMGGFGNPMVKVYMTSVTLIFVVAMALQVPRLRVPYAVKMCVFIGWAAYGVLPTLHWCYAMGGFGNPMVKVYMTSVTLIFVVAMALQVPRLRVPYAVKMCVFIGWAAYGVLPTLHWCYAMGGFGNPMVKVYMTSVTLIFVVAMALQVPRLRVPYAVKMCVFIGWAAYGVLPTLHWCYAMGGFGNPMVKVYMTSVTLIFVVAMALQVPRLRVPYAVKMCVFIGWAAYGVLPTLHWCYAMGGFGNPMVKVYMTSVTLIFVVAMALQVPRLRVPYAVKMCVFIGWAAYGVLPTLHWCYAMGGFGNPMVKVYMTSVTLIFVVAMALQVPRLRVPYAVKMCVFIGWAAYGVLPTLHWCYAMGGFGNPMVKVYMTSVTLIFVVAMALQVPRLRVPYAVKMCVFIGWAAYGVLPTLHWCYAMGGFGNPMVKMFFPRVMMMYAISGTAFIIYAFKVPERWFPGRVDYIGHSHQWWHVLVMAALYYWHNSGMMYVQYRMNHGCANTMRIF